MDLLKNLVNSSNPSSTCFLCFNQDEETLSVHQRFFVCDEYQSTDTTLTAIIKYLFPAHDIMFSQACTNCTNFLLKGFTILRKHNIMRDILHNITSNLTKEVECVRKIASTGRNLYVKLRLPFFTFVSRKSVEDGRDCSENESNNDIYNDLKCCNNIERKVSEYKHCKKCEMKFTSKHLLIQHEKIAHTNLNMSSICEYCGKQCNKPSTLKVHLNCHREKSCPYCLKILKSHSHYKIHVKNHEGHIKRTSRKTHYFCSICPFRSLNKMSLEAHVNKIHLQTRPFVCEICNKGFYKKSNLTDHQKVHTNVKTLTCEQCGESFVTKKTLIEHLRLHSGEKPFQCTICNLTFVTSGRRSEHIKRKHMDKTICCFICSKKFSLKKELNSHMKQIHGKSEGGEGITDYESNNLFAESFLQREEVNKL